MGLPAKKEGSGEILLVLEFKLMSHYVVTLLDLFWAFCSQYVVSKVQKIYVRFCTNPDKNKRNQIKVLQELQNATAFQVSI